MRTFKLNALAAGFAIAAAGSANAALTVDAQIFMSGATAPTNMLREHTVRNSCDQGSTINVYVNTVDNEPGDGDQTDGTKIMSQGSHFVVECTGGASLGALNGNTFALYKADTGSSGGTTPVANSLNISFMDADGTNCSPYNGSDGTNTWTTGTTSFELFECGADDFVNQVPDGGVSDIEPTQFVGELQGSSGAFVDNGNLQVQSGPGLVFGMGVTLQMRNELQADQGLIVGRDDVANMPSIPSTYIRSIYAGEISNWSDQTIYGNTLNVPAGYENLVNLCRRFQGSGTHAQYMVNFHRTNCTAGSKPMLSAGLGNPIFGNPNVYGMSGSSDVEKCLNALDDGTGWIDGADTVPGVPNGKQSFGLGYNSLEKNTTLSRDWRFVKIDGVAPTLENAYNGDYRDVYYLSFQNRNDGSYVNTGSDIRTGAANVALIDAFFANGLDISGPVAKLINDTLVVTPAVGAPWGGGFLVPSASAPSSFSAADPRTPWAREDLNGEPNSCQPLASK